MAIIYPLPTAGTWRYPGGLLAVYYEQLNQRRVIIMTIEILETSVQQGKGDDVLDRVEARFTLNGRHQRLIGYKYAIDLLDQFDKVIADEIRHLVETRDELRQEIKTAIKEGKIKKKYNTLEDKRNKKDKLTNDDINRLFRISNNMQGQGRSHERLGVTLRQRYYKNLRKYLAAGEITESDLQTFKYYHVPN